MNLEWWNPFIRYVSKKDQAKKARIKVVGLSLHLWTREILKIVGDCCERFLAMDKGTTLKTELLWVIILVRMKAKEKPSSIC